MILSGFHCFNVMQSKKGCFVRDSDKFDSIIHFIKFSSKAYYDNERKRWFNSTGNDLWTELWLHQKNESTENPPFSQKWTSVA